MEHDAQGGELRAADSLHLCVWLTDWPSCVRPAAQANGLDGHKQSGQADAQTQALLQQVREAVIKHAGKQRMQIWAYIMRFQLTRGV